MRSAWRSCSVAARASSVSQSVRPATTPAAREARSHAAMGAAAEPSVGPGQQTQDVAPPEVVVGQCQEVEHGAAGHAGGERAHRDPVAGDAGRGQVLVDEPAVGPSGAEQQADAFERCAVAHGLEHEAHGRTDLVVGVGGGDDARRGGRDREPRCVRPRRLAELHAQSPQRPANAPVRVGLPRQAHDHRGREAGRQRRDELGLAPQQVLGEVDDEGAELARQAGLVCRGHGGDRRVGEVGLVVPVVGQQRAGATAQPHDVVRAATGPGQRRQRVGRQVAQLGVRGHQRLLGGGVGRDRGEHAGLFGEGATEGGGDDGGGDRASPGGGERAGPEQLGQPVGGGERDGGDARAPGAQLAERTARQQPAGGDAHVVGGHDHRDRRQGVPRLGLGDRLAQRLERRAAVGGGEDLEGHGGQARQGV